MIWDVELCGGDEEVFVTQWFAGTFLCAVQRRRAVMLGIQLLSPSDACFFCEGGRCVMCGGDVFFVADELFCFRVQLGDGSTTDRDRPVSVSSSISKSLWDVAVVCIDFSSFTFIISSSDRVSCKSSVLVTLRFTPSFPIRSGSALTLSYPSKFFASSVVPSVASGASSVAGLTATCGATSATAVIITTSGAAIPASAFTITIRGFTMGEATAGSVSVRLRANACSISNAVSSGQIFSDIGASPGIWSTAQLSVARWILAATSVGNVAIFAGGLSGNSSFA
jgi:hypothetical protein